MTSTLDLTNSATNSGIKSMCSAYARQTIVRFWPSMKGSSFKSLGDANLDSDKPLASLSRSDLVDLVHCPRAAGWSAATLCSGPSRTFSPLTLLPLRTGADVSQPNARRMQDRH